MPKNIDYIRHYIGPVFFVEKKSVQYSTISRTIESCPNTACSKHQNLVRGTPLHCTECGSKIRLVHCEKQLEETPSSFTADFYKKCLMISNNNVNGTNSFMEPSVTFFENESHQVYIPKVERSNFNFGIINDRTVGTYCTNDNCSDKHHYTHSDYKHCPKCGYKLFINITHSVAGILPENYAISIFDQFTKSNFDCFKFVEDAGWEKMVHYYSKTQECQEIVSSIEQAYGVGSVTMRLAFASYHSFY